MSSEMKGKEPGKAAVASRPKLTAARDEPETRSQRKHRHAGCGIEERRREVSGETSSIKFEPNEFYERLILLRNTNPPGLARFSGATLAALQAYEAAKLKAKLEDMKRQQASAKPDDSDTKKQDAA